jgi:hypothetical protein
VCSFTHYFNSNTIMHIFTGHSILLLLLATHSDFTFFTIHIFQTPPQKRSRRKRKPDISLLFLLCLHLSCPQTYTQALKSPEHEAWKASMDLELHTLQHKRKCWEVVPYPKDGHHNFLRCHFVYKVKMKQGKVDRYKSRQVVDGSKQASGI